MIAYSGGAIAQRLMSNVEYLTELANAFQVGVRNEDGCVCFTDEVSRVIAANLRDIISGAKLSVRVDDSKENG